MSAAADLILAARVAKRAALDEIAGKQLLAVYGVAVPRSVTIPDAAAAAKAVAGLKPPYVVK
ncbi:MAG: acetyl-CoA synthetase, partial [Betaproteobacteria bacterium]|nr:acetyl-CoA synthetase [Betaproteobacteria bacterium]